MCGFVGCVSVREPVRGLESIVRQMADALRHRGPDDSGTWADESAAVALGHRRLSVLDLSEAGHQPMLSPSGRYALVFNGEIYNHLGLRRALQESRTAQSKDGRQDDMTTPSQGGVWRGHSDTETLLAAFEAWGVEDTLKRTVGMFAIALWDRARRTLTLARDRLGEKPLYYGQVRGALVFGSELKALRAYPGFDNRVDRRALALYVRHGYVPGPWSIYENIWKLPPGCWTCFSTAGGVPPDLARGPGAARPYWSARAVAEAGLQDPFDGSGREACDVLERLLLESVGGQMLSDVPLGAFLSGGIDSSIVVALMQAQSSQPVRTFTIGFNEDQYNEAEHARAVAHHLGTDHTELYLIPSQAQDVIPRLPALYDEPFADPSQVPTCLVAELARRHVTVSLSGDGGDELFGGYNRYFWANRLWRRIEHVPGVVRRMAGRALEVASPSAWNRLFGIMGPIIPPRLRYAQPGDKLHKIAGLFGASGPESVYLRLISLWDDPASLVLGGWEPETPITNPDAWLRSPNFEQRMMYLDTVTYLPDDILVKVDRAAMGVSLETRVPFLDHRVLEFAWRLPLSAKIRGDKGKWILREILSKYVPLAMIERPKMGFGVPIDQWLRGPLRDWAETLLSAERLQAEGYFDPGPIRERWKEHLSGRRNWQYHLWDILVFQEWLEAQNA